MRGAGAALLADDADLGRGAAKGYVAKASTAAAAASTAAAAVVAVGGLGGLLGPQAYLSRLLMARMTEEQLKYDRARCVRKAIDTASNVGIRSTTPALMHNDVGNDDAIVRMIVGHVKRAHMRSALQELQAMLCADGADGARSAGGAVERRLVKLATLHTCIWETLLMEVDPATADMILATCANVSSLQEKIFSVFEDDDSMALQQHLLNKAETMSENAWRAVVDRLSCSLC